MKSAELQRRGRVRERGWGKELLLSGKAFPVMGHCVRPEGGEKQASWVFRGSVVGAGELKDKLDIQIKVIDFAAPQLHGIIWDSEPEMYLKGQAIGGIWSHDAEWVWKKRVEIEEGRSKDWALSNSRRSGWWRERMAPKELGWVVSEVRREARENHGSEAKSNYLTLWKTKQY